MGYKKNRSRQKTHKRRKGQSKYMRVMIGCSKTSKNKRNKKRVTFSDSHNCPNCGPNCKCGKICNCPSPCPGNCNKGSIFGGSGCGSYGCPIAPLPMSGGNFYKPASPVPGPFVGQSWGTNVNKWPGVDGIGGNHNYLKFNNNVSKDPSYHQSMNDAGFKSLSSKVGGYKYKKRGGGLVPQDLVNLGRDVGFNFKSAYNALNGYPAPVDPAPYKGQLTGQLNNKMLI